MLSSMLNSSGDCSPSSRLCKRNINLILRGFRLRLFFGQESGRSVQSGRRTIISVFVSIQTGLHLLPIIARLSFCFMFVQVSYLLFAIFPDIISKLRPRAATDNGETVRCAVACHPTVLLPQSEWLACVRIFKTQIASPFSTPMQGLIPYQANQISKPLSR